jgi:hypothetical protein
MKFLFITFIIFIHGNLCLAHNSNEESETDIFDRIERYGLLLQRLSQLELKADNEKEPMPATPYVMIKGKRFYMNSGFYDLAEDVARLYHDEIKSVCAQCQLPSPVQVRAQAEALMAKGWLTDFAQRSGKTVFVRYGGEFVNLGSRYGTAAGLLKVAGELAEDALLVIFKMPGAHFLCEVITMGISYYSGGLLTLYRTWRNSHHLKQGSLKQFVRLTATSWLTRRALKRVYLDFGPISIDPDIFSDSHNNESVEWLAHEIDEEKKYRRFFEAVQLRLDKFDKEIAQLDAEILSTAPAQRERIERKRERLKHKMSRATSFKRKIFEARRLGLSLYLFKRNRALSLYSDEPEMNSYFKGSKLWLIPLTSTLTSPGFTFDPNKQSSFELYQRDVLRNYSDSFTTPVDQFLIELAGSRSIQPQSLSELFNDIDFIFSGQKLARARYARLTLMQGFLGEFLPKVVKSFVGDVREVISDQDNSLRSTKETTRLQWNAGQIAYYSGLYIDYLRSVAILSNPDSLNHFERYHAKEYLVDLLTTLEKLSHLKEIKNLNELVEINNQLSEQLKVLKSHRFWIEKKAGHSLIPIREVFFTSIGLGRYNFYRKKVKCEQLYY